MKNLHSLETIKKSIHYRYPNQRLIRTSLNGINKSPETKRVDHKWLTNPLEHSKKWTNFVSLNKRPKSGVMKTIDF